MPSINNNQLSYTGSNEYPVVDQSQQLGVDVYEDEHGIQYTKQRLIECIVSMGTGGMMGVGGINGNWYFAVQQMGKWYEANIHTYQTGTTGKAMGKKGWFMCPLIGDKVADDCSGFVQACLKLFGVNCPPICTADMQNEKFMNMMQTAGFTHYSGQFDKSNTQPGDILCGRAATHTEIMGDGGKVWSWGNIHDGQNGHSGLPCGFANISSKGGYIHCWRKI